MSDDLTDLKVEVRSLKNSFRIVGGVVTVVLSVATFFGYRQFDDFVRKRDEQVTKLLADANSAAVAEVKARIEQRRGEYEKLLDELGALIARGSLVERHVIEKVRPNKEVEYQRPDWHRKYVVGTTTFDNGMEVRECPTAFAVGERYNFVLVFDRTFDLEEPAALLVQVSSTEIKNGVVKDRDWVMDTFFEIAGRFNKLHVAFDDIDPGKYVLRIGYITRTGKKPADVYVVERAIEIMK